MNELVKTGYDMLYLSLCALNDAIPDKERVEEMNNNMLFVLCHKHSLTSLVYYALAKLFAPEQRWLEANGKINANSKVNYIFLRIFPPMEFYKVYYRFFYRHMLLLPICFLVRVYKRIFISRKTLKKEIQVLKKI